ncbi:MAG: SDR family NAD(P)-dependent oxidoreductase [Alphaproteobacteria bacterium]|nr:SDR family NAD(P)-dependent oxidoreductase [Alphaproteobacteria bacterium]
MRVANWTPDRLHDLEGRLYVVTGGNSGIGLEAAKKLARRNADVIIASRNEAKSRAAADALAPLGAGRKSTLRLDLADLSSVHGAAADLRGRTVKIDGLINNAGVMQTPRRLTKDGFELQFGTNHLGHFLWTALLFDLVEAVGGRVVTVSSIAHKYGRLRFDDLMLSARYDPTVAYCQSKFANLVFAMELARRLKAAASPAMSVACHPGYANTNLQSAGPGALLAIAYRFSNAIFAQSADQGAIPTVLAAAGDEAVSGGYYGPTGLFGLGGPVGDADVLPRAREEHIGKRLWAESERLVDRKWLM